MIFIIPIVILSSILSNNLKNSVFLNNFLANIYNGGIIIGFLTGDSKYIGHLWYLYASFIIFAFTFLILYVTKNKNILYLSIIPIILLDITLNINGESIISRILLYLPIFLIALLYTDIRLNNKQLSSIICNVLSIAFIIVFLINVFYPNILILNSILIFGFTLPFFILNVTNYLVRTRFINKSLITCGKHSFVIYLFHEPYILTILDMVVIGLLKINNVAMPFLITAITIIICIYISKTLKTYNLYKLVE
jgi:peptidoglycan/LPS O-acetylase OafA/YrhL